jgi:hypothetical protein
MGIMRVPSDLKSELAQIANFQTLSARHARPGFSALPPLFCHTVAALFPFDQANGRPICD